jgi:hypothetical protein
MKEQFKNFLLRCYLFISNSTLNKSNITQQAQEYDRLADRLRTKTPENVALYGHKVYSQNDEDGIITEIFNRIESNNTFMEIGIQDGKECNTLNLLLNNWRGMWVEGDRNYFNQIVKELNGDAFKDKLLVNHSFVDLENIESLYRKAAAFSNVNDLDFFSIDIDGNDCYLIEKMLSQKCEPKVFCIEYNGKFPPPMRVNIEYNKNHIWDKTEYQGASLQTFADVFQQYGYTLLCCNLVGINAFFIKNEYLKPFKSYPISDLYQPCRYHLSPIFTGHPPTLQFLKNKLKSNN